MSNKIKKVLITRNEAGRFNYEDNKNRTVETGDTAFLIEKENFVEGNTEELYFINVDNALESIK